MQCGETLVAHLKGNLIHAAIIYIDRTLRQEAFAIVSWNAFHLLEFPHMHIPWQEPISKVLHVFVLCL